MVLRCLVLVLFVLLPNYGSSQSYDEYHRLILKAEEHYFNDNNVDSALIYYQNCFESFDFVFARDPVNALQIAYREGRPIERFLIKAMAAGVTPSILASIPALTNFTKDSLPKFNLMQNYNSYRSSYLERINVKCLNAIYRLGMLDQITKYQRKAQTPQLFKMALEFGLPGERNCGIEDMEIHKELGGRAADFRSLRDSVSEKYGRGLRYYKLDQNRLIMAIPIVIMIHDECTYKYFEKDLMEAYMGGFIHPRDIGLIYDNAFNGDGAQCLMVPNRGVFGLSPFEKQRNVNVDKANFLRRKWNICSFETDVKKEELHKLGFRFIWDY